jgi:membrane protein YqaA with SNARE-associated domain
MSELIASEAGLWMLFLSGFLSATLLPGSSEAALIAAIKLGDHPLWLVITVATIGNTLGGLTNYGLGRLLLDKTSRLKKTQRALGWLKKYGYWSLLLSCLPFIGDPLCLAAGWLRMNFLWCTAAILTGKALRYMAIASI